MLPSFRGGKARVLGPEFSTTLKAMANGIADGCEQVARRTIEDKWVPFVKTSETCRILRL